VWFDWRMIPVMLLMLCGLVAAVMGVALAAVEWWTGWRGPGLAQAGLAPWHLALGGVAAVALAVGAAEWCRRNPDAGT
jgi:hypothetical protein